MLPNYFLINITVPLLIRDTSNFGEKPTILTISTVPLVGKWRERERERERGRGGQDYHMISTCKNVVKFKVQCKFQTIKVPVFKRVSLVSAHRAVIIYFLITFAWEFLISQVKTRLTSWYQNWIPLGPFF